MTRTAVISGFPGVGKTYLFNERTDLTILDSDSSRFSWVADGVRNPRFPQNYIEHIATNFGAADLILVSSHKVVRDALRDTGIEYVLVYPDRSLKAEYMQRYKDRGSGDPFVVMLETRWDEFMDEMDAETWPTKRILRSGENLSDVLKMPRLLNKPPGPPDPPPGGPMPRWG